MLELKIVCLSSSIILSKTANSVHVMKMCQGFANLGHEVILIAPDKPNVEIHIIGGNEEGITFWKNETKESMNVYY